MDNTTTEQAPVLTVEQFLAKYPDYVVDTTIQGAIEVDCRKRNDYVRDEEIVDLLAMGYRNVFNDPGRNDMTMMCCGCATFVPAGEIIWLD